MSDPALLLSAIDKASSVINTPFFLQYLISFAVFELANGLQRVKLENNLYTTNI